MEATVFQKTVDHPNEYGHGFHVALDDGTWVIVRRDQVKSARDANGNRVSRYHLYTRRRIQTPSFHFLRHRREVDMPLPSIYDYNIAVASCG